MCKIAVQYFGLTLLVLFANGSSASSKGYIDLLELPDNDEFQWGSDENSYGLNNSSSAAHEMPHHLHHSLRKRQAPGAEQLNQKLGDFGACKTPQGEVGRCRHIIYCRLPELKNDVWRLVSQLCVIEKTSVGICCPNRVISRLGPQIITDVNSLDFGGSRDGDGESRIVNHAEQRGCGITTKQFPRITGGRPAEPDEWPWMAAILRPGLPFVWCGGVLVTDRHVLTAAHCIHKFKIDQLFVRLGEYNTHLLNETRARDFYVASMVTHLDYDPLTFENDIGLVRVEKATLFNTYIWPVCMPPIGENWEGRVGIVTGWGTKTFGGPHSEILMEVNLPIWKQSDCRSALVERVPDTVMCAGVPEGGQDSCQGDSGGPLLIQLPNRRWVAVGIVSWGIRCGEPNRPGLYTRVDKYLHWIIENSDI